MPEKIHGSDHVFELSPDATPEDNEDAAQYHLAAYFYPGIGKGEAFLKYVEQERGESGKTLAKRFRDILENDPGIKDRIDRGDISALEELRAMIGEGLEK